MLYYYGYQGNTVIADMNWGWDMFTGMRGSFVLWVFDAGH